MENAENNQTDQSANQTDDTTLNASPKFSENKKDLTAPRKALDVTDDEIYKFVVAHWHHHNQLSWNKLNVILALETATLGGAFSIESSWVRYGLLFVGSVVGVILYQLVLRDWHVRDYNLPIIDKVHSRIKFDWNGQEHSMRMIPQAPSPFSRGQTLLKLLMALLIATNFAALLVLSHRDKIPSPDTSPRERSAILSAPSQLADSRHDQPNERAINVVAMNLIEKPEVSVNVPSANPGRNIGPAEQSKKPQDKCAKSGDTGNR